MKRLEGGCSTEVQAPRAACFALLADVEHYPDWYPDVVSRVTVSERADDGAARRADATLHLAYGPLTRDFDLMLDVSATPESSVTLTRVPHDGSDPEQFEVRWQLAGDSPTRIEVRLEANLSVPRLLPVGGVADGIAEGFVATAKRALER